jgi:hypothetical protein
MKSFSLGLVFLLLSGAALPASSLAQGTSVKKAKAEKKPSWVDNIRMLYLMIYDGPRLTNFDLTKTQGVNDTEGSYTDLINIFRVGYAVTKRVVVGVTVTGFAPLDPQKQFLFGDLSNYVSWGKMVETDHLEIQGQFIVFYPTSERSRMSGKLLALRGGLNWNFKTPLRNWNFSASTKFTSHFFRDPSEQTDFVVALEPAISVDVLPNVQWLLQGEFDAAHKYSAVTYDFNQAGGDSFNTGPNFTIGSHISLTTAIKFYTERVSFDTATLYSELAVSL